MRAPKSTYLSRPKSALGASTSDSVTAFSSLPFFIWLPQVLDLSYNSASSSALFHVLPAAATLCIKAFPSSLPSYSISQHRLVLVLPSRPLFYGTSPSVSLVVRPQAYFLLPCGGPARSHLPPFPRGVVFGGTLPFPPPHLLQRRSWFTSFGARVPFPGVE